MTLELELKLLGYWHVGTGRGSGVGYDAAVFRTKGGLPCIPGKQLKGLLRCAVEFGEKIGLYGQDPISEPLFGTAIPPEGKKNAEREKQLENIRFVTEPGILQISSATLGSDWEKWGASHEMERDLLFRELASTKLDDDGMAADHTLRSIEVAVPMTLRASVTALERAAWPEKVRSGALAARIEKEWPAWFEKALPYMDAAGGHRTRGLGRLEIRRVP